MIVVIPGYRWWFVSFKVGGVVCHSNGYATKEEAQAAIDDESVFVGFLEFGTLEPGTTQIFQEPKGSFDYVAEARRILKELSEDELDTLMTEFGYKKAAS